MKAAADAVKAASNLQNSTEASVKQEQLLSSAASVLGEWLDRQKGKDVTDNSIFAELPRYYEDEFIKDMEALNVCILLLLFMNGLVQQWYFVKIWVLGHWYDRLTSFP